MYVVKVSPEGRQGVCRVTGSSHLSSRLPCSGPLYTYTTHVHTAGMYTPNTYLHDPYIHASGSEPAATGERGWQERGMMRGRGTRYVEGERERERTFTNHAASLLLILRLLSPTT